jgi:hypothetical protein
MRLMCVCAESRRLHTGQPRILCRFPHDLWVCSVAHVESHPLVLHRRRPCAAFSGQRRWAQSAVVADRSACVPLSPSLPLQPTPQRSRNAAWQKGGTMYADSDDNLSQLRALGIFLHVKVQTAFLTKQIVPLSGRNSAIIAIIKSAKAMLMSSCYSISPVEILVSMQREL